MKDTLWHRCHRSDLSHGATFGFGMFVVWEKIDSFVYVCVGVSTLVVSWMYNLCWGTGSCQLLWSSAFHVFRVFTCIYRTPFDHYVFYLYLSRYPFCVLFWVSCRTAHLEHSYEASETRRTRHTSLDRPSSRWTDETGELRAISS